ncbi:calcium-binding and coiled-coil domain-containing protein 2-like [Tigriopus californicus]|uniref:calcium-binding and coiled-coil domain-containing protein 2-like n=1 Tax=Tigriopus californicus TaxID=6832 RepID=UPI0027DA92DC|nr:calcium-binding and coiled-coil domain-containing protein 2-like [Tigriopus californicus]
MDPVIAANHNTDQPASPSISDGDFTILDHLPGESETPIREADDDSSFTGQELGPIRPSPLMTQSRYSQVLFHDVPTSFPEDQDLLVRFSLNDETLDWQTGGWIGLFRLTHTRADQAVLKVPVSTDPPQFHVVFPAASLPRDPQYYQFQFIQWTGQCVGASLAFHLGPLPMDNQPEEALEVTADQGPIEVAEESRSESVQSLRSLSKVGVDEMNQDRMAELERNLAYYHKKCQVLEREAEFVKSERDMARMVEANLKSQHQQTDASLSRAKAKIEELVSMLTALTQSKQMATSEIQALAKEKDQIQSEVNALKETLSEREAKVETLEGCLSSLGHRHENLEMEKEALEKSFEHMKTLAAAERTKIEQELFEAKEQLETMEKSQKIVETNLTKSATVTEAATKVPSTKIEELELLVKDLQIGLRESAEIHAQEIKVLRDDFHELRSLASYSPSVASSTNFMNASEIEKTLLNASESKDEAGQTDKKDHNHGETTVDMLMQKMYTGGFISTEIEPIETDYSTPLMPQPVNKESEALDRSDLAELMKWAEEQDEPEEPTRNDSTSTNHDAELPVPVLEEVLTCPVCQEDFSGITPSQLRDHVDDHFPARLRCPICEREFAPDNSLVYQNHVHAHFSPDGDDFSLIGDFTDEYDSDARAMATPSQRSSSTVGNYANRFHQWLQNID